MKYTVRTMERPYEGGEFKLYTRQMTEKNFNEMISLYGFHIAPEYSETEFANNGDLKFEQFGMTFNSSLRHTACRVVQIEQDNKLIYQYGNNATRFTDKKFETRIASLWARKNGISEEKAA